MLLATVRPMEVALKKTWTKGKLYSHSEAAGLKCSVLKARKRKTISLKKSLKILREKRHFQRALGRRDIFLKDGG